MIAISSFLAVVALSLLVVRVATVALELTGLSAQLARFQARSAFTGAGFTTAESEKVVQHPVRRRVIMLLMLLGNAGVVTAISSLLLSFLGESSGPFGGFSQVAVMVLGLGVLWWAATSQFVNAQMSKLISWALRRFTTVEARDYEQLFRLTGDYVVAELAVRSDAWLAGRSLNDLGLTDEGLIVLGVERGDGSYVGVPRGATRLKAGDTVLIYGRNSAVDRLDHRRQGSEGAWDRVAGVEEQKAIEILESEDAQADAA